MGQSHALTLAAQRSRRLSCGVRGIILILAACSLCLIVLCYHHPSQAGPGSSSIVQVTSYSRRIKLDEEAQWQQAYANDTWVCPLRFDRTTYAEVKARDFKPYILGGQQRPDCTNCHEDHLWAHFCKFESSGPVCTEWDQWRIVDAFVQRADKGAPGVKQMLTMTPCDLFRIIEGRTLWLVGDSLTQEYMRAMQCFFSEFWNFKEEYKALALTDDPEVKAALSKQPTGWCVYMMLETRLCHLRGNYGIHLTEDIFPYLFKLGAVKSDILVFNVGVWHNDLATFTGNMTKVEDYLKVHQSELPYLIWREGAPQHFDTPQGEFRCDGCPDPAYPFECKSIPKVTLDASNRLQSKDPAQRVVLEGGWRNKISRPIMEGLNIPIVDIWNESVPLWDYHHNYQVKNDCTHMCHPSAYQLWISQLYRLLEKNRASLPIQGAVQAIKPLEEER